jgi:hypothetical protein
MTRTQTTTKKKERKYNETLNGKTKGDRSYMPKVLSRFIDKTLDKAKKTTFNALEKTQDFLGKAGENVTKEEKDPVTDTILGRARTALWHKNPIRSRFAKAFGSNLDRLNKLAGLAKNKMSPVEGEMSDIDLEVAKNERLNQAKTPEEIARDAEKEKGRTARAAKRAAKTERKEANKE